MSRVYLDAARLYFVGVNWSVLFPRGYSSSRIYTDPCIFQIIDKNCPTKLRQVIPAHYSSQIEGLEHVAHHFIDARETLAKAESGESRHE